MTHPTITDFHTIEYTYEDTTRVVYHGGATTDPLVFLLHEIPNPTPQVFELGRRIISGGIVFTFPYFLARQIDRSLLDQRLRSWEWDASEKPSRCSPATPVLPW